ncbi:hypothetical protein KLMA_10027 [Kluyveromyces marxianus DMKU3-1042]|uniref:Uncharacterized protein n=1 Tax=Kluyveromyces marxianus (strain DMKU3-1042 / BCC 29191 / NBRC 104275) TaxID=1003335 RepID=W0T6C0_KLUMD|nr:hypothetical protein KLMA_10027 [Kluyveromyces marxianus DMKU3-1042]BAO37649.1 hypothetical protein KLMA_10027 [Kluyveromyces marxianus DMKU3-1042]
MALAGKRSHLLVLREHTNNNSSTKSKLGKDVSIGGQSDGRFILSRKRVKLNSERCKVSAEYSSPIDSDDDRNDTGYSSVDFDSMIHPSRKPELNFPDPSALAQLVNCSASGSDNFNSRTKFKCENLANVASNTTSNESATEIRIQAADSNPNDTAVFSSTASTANYLTTAVPRPLSRHSSCVVPQSDLLARERCFDYIVQSIDEVWARYCDTTSSAENQLYPYGYASPVSESDISGNESDSGYKSNTDTETDNEHRKVSNLPDSKELQSLKDRLTKAKHALEQTVDSLQFQDCMLFWNRWDMIKYNAVEMMEEEDDDELVESVIEELEEGRWYNES